MSVNDDELMVLLMHVHVFVYSNYHHSLPAPTNRFGILSDLTESADPIESIWNAGVAAITETSRTVIGTKRKKKHHWISDETLAIIDEHRKARLSGDKTTARQLASKRKQLLRRDERSWYNKVADDAETASKAGNTAELYRTIRTLSGKTSAQLPPVEQRWRPT